MGTLLRPTREPFLDKNCVISLVSAIGFMAMALILGIADNPPGILLLFASVLALVLAMVHHWRSPKRFLKMMVMSLVAFPVMVILHNFLGALAESGPYWMDAVLSGLSVIAFLVAVIVLPVTFFSGIIGIVLTGFGNLKQGD